MKGFAIGHPPTAKEHVNVNSRWGTVDPTVLQLAPDRWVATPSANSSRTILRSTTGPPFCRLLNFTKGEVLSQSSYLENACNADNFVG